MLAGANWGHGISWAGIYYKWGERAFSISLSPQGTDAATLPAMTGEEDTQITGEEVMEDIAREYKLRNGIVDLDLDEALPEPATFVEF